MMSVKPFVLKIIIIEDTLIPFFGDGSMRRDHTYIGDIVDCVIKALDRTDFKENRFDIFNLGNSRTISLSELVAMIEMVVGKNAVLTRFPQPPGGCGSDLCRYHSCSNGIGICSFDFAGRGNRKRV